MDTRKEGRNWRKRGILGWVELELERKKGAIGGTERLWRDRDRREGEFRQGSEGGRVQTGIGGRNRGETGIGGREVSEEGKDTRKGGIREEREEECFEEGGRRVFLGILNLVG